MRPVLYVLVVLLIAQEVGIAQQRYFDNVFAEAVVTRNVAYGTAPDYQGAMQALLLDVYTPLGDNEPQRPLIILVHGGGFTGGGKAGENFQTWGRELARRGFVVASIDYRLGTTSKIEAKPMYEASYRAQQDVRASVRYLRAHAGEHGIDTSRIYLVGTSAGGFAALHAAVLEQDEVPDYVDAALGDVEGPSGTPGLSSTVHGVVSCWGAVPDTLNIDVGDPPIAAVHGTADKTVPYQCGDSRFGFELCGGEALTARAASLGIEHDLLLFQGAGHTLDGDPTLLDSCYVFLADFIATLATKNVTTVQQSIEHQPVVWNSVYDLHGRQVATLATEEPSIEPPSTVLDGLTSGVYLVVGRSDGRVRSVIRVAP